MRATEQTAARRSASMQALHLPRSTPQEDTMNSDSQPQATGRGAHANPNGTDPSHSPSGIVREYHKLLADLEDLMGSASTLTSEELARAKAALSARITTARASAARIGNVVSERVQAGARVTDEYVHKQPWQAVGIAAGAGLLVGFLLGRRNS